MARMPFDAYQPTDTFSGVPHEAHPAGHRRHSRRLAVEKRSCGCASTFASPDFDKAASRAEINVVSARRDACMVSVASVSQRTPSSRIRAVGISMTCTSNITIRSHPAWLEYSTSSGYRAASRAMLSLSVSVRSSPSTCIRPPTDVLRANGILARKSEISFRALVLPSGFTCTR